MVFLIDYENVQSAGMRGSEWLGGNDYVIVFYSQAAMTMENRYLREIESSACKFEVCKLVKARKNALDFYIATKVGELFGSGYEGEIAVISKDNGYHAIKDYWGIRSSDSRRIILAESVERAIINSGKKTERKEILLKQVKNIDIGNFYSAYSERKQLVCQLNEIFKDTEYHGKIMEILNVLNEGKTSKIIYTKMLHQFGRKEGLEIYRNLKAGKVA